MIHSGDTAFMFVCTGMVQFMTPGLAFFYGGLVRSTNVVSIMLQSFAAIGFVFVAWYVVGFSLAFGRSMGGFIGNPTSFPFWCHLPVHESLESGINTNLDVPNIPGVLFAGYQGMFAVITPALMTGAFADRMRWLPYIIFVSAWMLVVYAPVCHWVWGGGWMGNWGCWDFAGGIVVHVSSGFSALACLRVLGKRNLPEDPVAKEPHNVPFVALGTAMLWFGWFGFNGGSSLKADGIAAVAAMNTQIAGSVSMTAWLLLEAFIGKKPGLVGACVGAVAGLATITPAAGYVTVHSAFGIGLIASVVCFACVFLIQRADLDDALDVWGVHGMGGFTGTILVGALAKPYINPGTAERSFELVGIQSVCAIIVAVYCFVVTSIILFILDKTMKIRLPRKYEDALDAVMHGEQAYITHKSSENLLANGVVESSESDSSDTGDDKKAAARRLKISAGAV
uniref:Ammonium transporter n=1 Tax=Zooxanthella nutricula TaxID=1333877 RepID=A0A7S2L3G8_9DINO